jgi:phospholipase/carboxylesterase
MFDSPQANWRQHLAAQGRLMSRPSRPTEAAPLGLQQLELEAPHEGLLYVPVGYRVDQPAPLVLMLHGAGGNAQQGLAPFRGLADAYGLILLAISSAGRTWDVIIRHFGADIAVIDQALAHVFDRYAVDPAHLAIEGFSDGASYALSVGLTNGALFSHVIAFSPGFLAPTAVEGKPQIFVSHGQRDTVLPIDRCSRRLVPHLQQLGYDIRYREFAGAHTVPPAIAQEALNWFMNEPSLG